jgi:hypothetical protein
MRARGVVTVAAILGLSVGVAHYAPALPDNRIAPPSRQFGLPFSGKPGVNTWLLGQLYGNTTGAFRRRNSDYRAGQGIHFGMDFSAPCGTPVLAIGDGVVSEVDGPHGSPPHNLVINHAGNLSSLYGHLQRRSSLRVGQRVKRGDVIGVSGDSQFTCISAPHLHLEIRDTSHQRFFNPVGYIDADWDSLALVGSFGRGYQRDLNNPRRWQSLQDQPQARRGGTLLNNYARPWPPAPEGRAPNYPSRIAVAPRVAALTSSSSATASKRLTSNKCCVNPFWSADSSRVYFLDKPGAEPAALYGVSAINPSGTRREFSSVVSFSPSQRIAVMPGNEMILERLSDGKRVRLPTRGNGVSFSPSETRVAWSVSSTGGRFDTTTTRIYTATLSSSFTVGTSKLVATVYGGGISGWLNENELLVSGKSDPSQRNRSLRAINFMTGAGRAFTNALNFRGVSIAPGGRWVAYYVAFDNPQRNGMFMMDTKTGSSRRLNWLGSYRWRTANRIAYIPLETTTGQHRLFEFDASSNQKRELARLEGKVAGDDWQLAPNGERLVYVNARDRDLYALEL